MKTALLLLLCSVISFTCFSQQVKQGIKVKLLNIPFPGKLMVKIHSDTVELSNCRLRIINEKGVVVKTLNFFNTKKDIEATILTEDLEYGKYVCIVSKDTEQLYKEEFFKDAIYMDMGLPNIWNTDSIQKE